MAQGDDLSAKLGEILSSPEQMQQIQNLAAMLGLSPDTAAQGQNHVSAPPSSGDKEDGGLDPAMIAAITSAFSKMGSLSREDNGVALLLALKPLLGEQRQKRVDEATKMLKLARMLPLLQDAGILRVDF